MTSAPRKTLRGLLLGTSILLFSMGHGGGCGDEEILGPPTEATCPTGSTLTYTNFGKPFMEQYCTRCHDSAKTGSARNGAPLYHDFDTQLGIQQVSNHVDETAGSGPAATNEAMPPDGAKPTLEERQKLAEWIACGAP